MPAPVLLFNNSCTVWQSLGRATESGRKKHILMDSGEHKAQHANISVT